MRVKPFLFPLLFATLSLLFAPAAGASTQASAGIAAAEQETVSSAALERTYSFSDDRTSHQFTVTFDSATGAVKSTAGGDGKDFLIGSAEAQEKVREALMGLVDAGVTNLYFNGGAPGYSKDSRILVVNQGTSPSSSLLPAAGTYDAVGSFALPDGGRALLFWNEGELVEGRVFSSQAFGPKINVDVEIDCTITYDPQQGFKIHCTLRIRINGFPLPPIELF